MNATNNRPNLRILSFKPVRKGTLRGFAEVALPNGLNISDVVVGESNGKTWALVPSKAMLDRDGNVIREDNGKPRYSPVIQWSTPNLREEFSRRVATLVQQVNPAAFDPPANL